MSNTGGTPYLQKDDEDNKPAIRKHSDKVLSPISTSPEELAELARRVKELASQVDERELENRAKYLNLDSKDDSKPIIEELKAEISTVVSGGEEPVSAHPKIRHRNYSKTANPAAELIRSKLANIYSAEPNAKEEAKEAQEAGKYRSKHQQFMLDLTNSGKSLAQIQTEWHKYYVALPDDEKHNVWQEFYRMQEHSSRHPVARQQQKELEPVHHTTHKPIAAHTSANDDPRTVAEVKSQLISKINAGGKLTVKHHLKSLAFGLGSAGVVCALMMFTFFNEVFIAPFISPSRTVTATPIIGNANSPVGPEPKIIIPKINLEVPVVYDVASVEEKDVQAALEQGVVHYIASPKPGEQGNSVIVGHSSNNILNKGKYKFAFVLLKRLELEDTIMVHRDGIRYTYKVYNKKIVEPNDVSVLGTAERPNTITLITCDPPGTSLRRLIIQAEQISPDPNANTTVTTAPVQEVTELPSNAPSLWSRIFD